jgi:hypothetical protein
LDGLDKPYLIKAVQALDLGKEHFYPSNHRDIFPQ